MPAPLAEIPNDVKESLRTVMDLQFTDVDVRVERVPASMIIGMPRAHAAVGLRRVVGRFRGGRRSAPGLKVIGATIGETIYIDPAYARWDTAAGQALLAHERLHLEQKRTIRNFDQKYAEEDARTPEERPWENPYEYAAYLLECKVFAKLLRKGMPQGSWIPLGAQIGLCRV